MKTNTSKTKQAEGKKSSRKGTRNIYRYRDPLIKFSGIQ